MARNYKRDRRGRFARIAGRRIGKRAQKNATRALRAYSRGDHAFGDHYARKAVSQARIASSLGVTHLKR